MPGLSGIMSTVSVCEGEMGITSARWPFKVTVFMPVRGVKIVGIAERHKIPTHTLSLLHGHHRHLAEHVAVDRVADIGM